MRKNWFNTLEPKGNNFFKIVKYFSKGVIHSYEQLYELKKI